jgi:hypothetical protein
MPYFLGVLAMIFLRNVGCALRTINGLLMKNDGMVLSAHPNSGGANNNGWAWTPQI